MLPAFNNCLILSASTAKIFICNMTFLDAAYF